MVDRQSPFLAPAQRVDVRDGPEARRLHARAHVGCHVRQGIERPLRVCEPHPAQRIAATLLPYLESPTRGSHAGHLCGEHSQVHPSRERAAMCSPNPMIVLRARAEPATREAPSPHPGSARRAATRKSRRSRKAATMAATGSPPPRPSASAVSAACCAMLLAPARHGMQRLLTQILSSKWCSNKHLSDDLDSLLCWTSHDVHFAPAPYYASVHHALAPTSSWIFVAAFIRITCCFRGVCQRVMAGGSAQSLCSPEVLWLWMQAAALAKRSGAARYPSRHPVIANALLKPFTVSVRCRMPGGRDSSVKARIVS